MKKCIPLLLLLLALTPNAIALTEFPRHIDPSTAPSTTNILDYLTLLHTSSMYLAELNINRAINIISTLREATIPQQFRDIFNRTLQLYTLFTVEINMSIRYMNLSEEVLKSNDLDKCGSLILAAQQHLGNAEQLYTQIRDVLNYLVGAGGAVEETIKSTLNNMEKAISFVRNRIDAVSKELEERRHLLLKEVELEVKVNKSKVFYGDFIEIRGRVEDPLGAPLGNRTIAIYYNATIYRSTPALWLVQSSVQGFFRASVPVKACGVISIRIAFIPQGFDANVYRYTEKVVNVTSLCIEPTISVHMQRPLLIGANNSMCIESSIPNLRVNISSKGLALSKQVELSTHTTCLGILIPANVSEGMYRVDIFSEAKRGVPPKALHIYVNVSRLDANLSIEHPTTFFVGVPQSICVKTSVNSSVEIMLIELGRVVALKSSNSCTDLLLPISYLGTQLDLEIHVTPYNATYRSKVVKISIQVLDPIPIAVTVLIIILMVLVYGRGGARISSAVMAIQRRSETIYQILSPVIKEFVDFVKALTGVGIEAHMTLREYVNSALDRAPQEMRSALLAALRIAENILYGPPTHVEELVKRLKEVLSGLVRVLRL